MQAHEACAGDNVAARTEAVTTVCCDEATEDCSSGYPASCNEGCAEILLPFISDCRPVLGKTAAAFKPVVKLCQQAEEERQQSAAREKYIGGSGGSLDPLRLFLNPLGLFLCTSIPFTWCILSAFLRA